MVPFKTLTLYQKTVKKSSLNCEKVLKNAILIKNNYRFVKISIIKLMTKTQHRFARQLTRFRQTNRKLDRSWLLYVGLVGVILAIGVELIYPINYWWLVVLIVISALLCRKLTVMRLVLALVVGLLIGSCRARTVFQQANQYQSMINTTVELSGRLLDDVTTTQAGNRLLRLGEIKLNQRMMVGEVLVSTRQKMTLRRGDYVVVAGKLEPGVGKYRAKLSRLQSIEIISYDDWSTGLRDWLEQRLRRFVSGERADLISAIVLGKRANLSRNLNRQIRTVGLSHIVVASGLHLMIVVGLVRPWFSKLSRRWEVLGALVVATLFGLTAGLSASMTRALMTLGVVLVTWFYGHKISGWRVIILLVATSLLLNPLHLCGDLSWWLSYGAFFGVLVAVPAVQDYFFGDKKLNAVSQLLLAVVVVQIVVAPILLVSFGELSLIAPLTNLLVVPLLVLLMWLAGLVIILANLTPVAWVVAYILQLLSYYILSVMQILSQFPRALVELKLTQWQIGLWVMLVGVLIAWMSYKNWRLAQIKHLQKIAKLLASSANRSKM